MVRERIDPAATLLPLIAALIILAWWRMPHAPAVKGDPPPRVTTIRFDPDVASVADLSLLPGIGPTKARDMVAQRLMRLSAGVAGSARVFRQPSDLVVVKGIGPKTIARIAPYLQFPSPTQAEPR